MGGKGNIKFKQAQEQRRSFAGWQVQKKKRRSGLPRKKRGGGVEKGGTWGGKGKKGQNTETPVFKRGYMTGEGRGRIPDKKLIALSRHGIGMGQRRGGEGPKNLKVFVHGRKDLRNQGRKNNF